MWLLAGVAPLYSSPSSPPKIAVVPVVVDLGRAQHDVRGVVDGLHDRVVGIRVVADCR